MVRSVLARFGWVLLVTLPVSSPVCALDVKTGLWEVTMQGPGIVQKACMTRELLDADISEMKMPEGVECTNEIKEKSAKLVVTHTVCTGTFAIEGDTRVEVLSPESMSMHSKSVMNFAGHEQEVDAIVDYKWLSSDCGDVKPFDLKHGFD